ncbi:MAG TPA: DUF6455 family protein [Beijerinckiaceae bacterium]|nr:DUF6455 family protein [Beijerinckiaceae bacterium]
MSSARAITTASSFLSRVLSTVAGLRDNLQLAFEIGRSDPETARRILEERGLIDGPHWQVPARAWSAVRILYRMMRSLGLDPAQVAAAEPQVMRTMQRACIACGARPRCEQALERCASRSTYQEFCANAARLDALRARGLAA